MQEADTADGGAGDDKLIVKNSSSQNIHLEDQFNGKGLSNIETYRFEGGKLAGVGMHVSHSTSLKKIEIDSPEAMADGARYTISTRAANNVMIDLKDVKGTNGGATSTIWLYGNHAEKANFRVSGLGDIVHGSASDLTLDVNLGRLVHDGAVHIESYGKESTFTLTNSGKRINTFDLSGDQRLTINLGNMNGAGGVTVNASNMTARLTLNATAENDGLVVLGSNFGNTVTGGNGDDGIAGGEGNDILQGGGGNDTLYGGKGNDKLYGGAGDDTFHGGEGDDWLYGNYDNDFLHGAEGDDTLFGGEGNDRLHGASGNDRLQGGAGDDELYGGEDNDTLSGGADDDKLYGGWGDDVLSGGTGNDYMRGGIGSDTYILDFTHSSKDKHTIDNYSSDAKATTDIIRVASGIKPSDIALSRHNDDLILTLKTTSKSVTVQDFFKGSHYEIDKVTFADGTEWKHCLP